MQEERDDAREKHKMKMKKEAHKQRWNKT